MPDILVRDVDVAVLERIKATAKRSNRSLQAHLKNIIRDAAEQPDLPSEIELLRKFRGSLKTQKTSAVDLLREDRDR